MTRNWGEFPIESKWPTGSLYKSSTEQAEFTASTTIVKERLSAQHDYTTSLQATG
jgi:hypothetical protein